MLNVDALVKDYASMERNSLLMRLGKLAEPVVNTLKIIFEEDNKKVALALVAMVTTACGADGSIDQAEYDLFADVFGKEFLSYSDFKAIVNTSISQDGANVIDNLIDSVGNVSPELKECFVHFILCFLAANGKINSSEIAFIKKIAQ